MEDVSQERPGQRFAFVMDTRLCEAMYELADGVDPLVTKATCHNRTELGNKFG